MWRGEVRRGRAGQAFDFGEPGVLDGATAKSLAAGRHGPRQVGQIVKTKPLTRSCFRILDQSPEPREPALQATGRWGTAKLLAAGRHGPRQVGQIVKTKPLTRSCCGF